MDEGPLKCRKLAAELATWPSSMYSDPLPSGLFDNKHFPHLFPLLPLQRRPKGDSCSSSSTESPRRAGLRPGTCHCVVKLAALPHREVLLDLSRIIAPRPPKNTRHNRQPSTQAAVPSGALVASQSVQQGRDARAFHLLLISVHTQHRRISQPNCDRFPSDSSHEILFVASHPSTLSDSTSTCDKGSYTQSPLNRTPPLPPPNSTRIPEWLICPTPPSCPGAHRKHSLDEI